MTTNETIEFDPSALCSRKLWQLVQAPEQTTMDKSELDQAIRELTRRRHYLAELARVGKLGSSSQMN